MHAAAFVPLHLPPHVVPIAVHGVRVPTGAPVVGEHVPIFPATLHAAHCEPQAESQQTPSMQLPVAHSFEPPHDVPFGFFALQWFVAEQKKPVPVCWQSESIAHVVAHDVALAHL